MLTVNVLRASNKLINQYIHHIYGYAWYNYVSIKTMTVQKRKRGFSVVKPALMVSTSNQAPRHCLNYIKNKLFKWVFCFIESLFL